MPYSLLILTIRTSTTNFLMVLEPILSDYSCNRNLAPKCLPFQREHTDISCNRNHTYTCQTETRNVPKYERTNDRTYSLLYGLYFPLEIVRLRFNPTEDLFPLPRRTISETLTEVNLINLRW